MVISERAAELASLIGVMAVAQKLSPAYSFRSQAIASTLIDPD
jgi:hypothetical protein